MFPGQGSQWVGMGRSLLDSERTFREAIGEIEPVVQAISGLSLAEEIRAEAPRLDRIEVVQPLLFAMQVALARLWRERGVEPAAVLGHSMGEAAAAAVAGCLSVEDAARVIAVRSRLLARLAGCGGMAVVDLPLEEAKTAIAGRPEVL